MGTADAEQTLDLVAAAEHVRQFDEYFARDLCGRFGGRCGQGEVGQDMRCRMTSSFAWAQPLFIDQLLQVIPVARSYYRRMQVRESFLALLDALPLTLAVRRAQVGVVDHLESVRTPQLDTLDLTRQRVGHHFAPPPTLILQRGSQCLSKLLIGEAVCQGVIHSSTNKVRRCEQSAHHRNRFCHSN